MVLGGNWLFYATAGVATENRILYSTKVAGGNTISVSDEQQHTGVIVGGGLEILLAKNISLREEALYFDGGRERYNFPAPAPFTSTSPTSSFSQLIYRVGLTYHFN